MLTQDACRGTSTSYLQIIFQSHCCSSILRFQLPFLGVSWSMKKLVLLLSAILIVAIVIVIVTRPGPSGDLTTQGDFLFDEFWILNFLFCQSYTRRSSIKYVNTCSMIFDTPLPHVSNRQHFNTPSLKSTSAFAKMY